MNTTSLKCKACNSDFPHTGKRGRPSNRCPDCVAKGVKVPKAAKVEAPAPAADTAPAAAPATTTGSN